MINLTHLPETVSCGQATNCRAIAQLCFTNTVTDAVEDSAALVPQGCMFRTCSNLLGYTSRERPILAFVAQCSDIRIPPS
jgi:hypothetical protein